MSADGLHVRSVTESCLEERRQEGENISYRIYNIPSCCVRDTIIMATFSGDRGKPQ